MQQHPFTAHDHSPGAFPGPRQRRRARNVDDVEEHAARRRAERGRDWVGRPRGQRRDDQVGGRELSGRRREQRVPRFDTHAVHGALQRADPGERADIDHRRAASQLSERRERRGRRRPAAEHCGRPPHRRAARRPVRGGQPLGQRGHDAVHVRVRPDQHRSLAPCLDEHGVHRADRGGQRFDVVEQGQHRLLERHRQAQARPGRVEPGDEPGQPVGRDVDDVVPPAGQSQRRVGRAVQRGRRRVRNRMPEHSGPAFGRCLQASARTHFLGFAACHARSFATFAS